MFFNYGYVLYQAERPKTAAQLREADGRDGELAAAMSHFWYQSAGPAHWLGRMWTLARTGPPAVNASPLAQAGLAVGARCQPTSGAELTH